MRLDQLLRPTRQKSSLLPFLIILIICSTSPTTSSSLPTLLDHSSSAKPQPRSFFNIIQRRSTGKNRTTNFSHYYQKLAQNSLPDLAVTGAENDIESNSLSGGSGSLAHAHEELFRIVTEATPSHLALSLLPAFIVTFGSFSAFVKEKLYIGEAILAVVFGIILGPHVSGVFDPRSWNGGEGFDDMTLELTRIVIALSVFAVGVELPKAYILKHWRSLAYLLGPIMLVGWLISGALIYVLIPALNFLQALVVAAAVTPTDPILAASVVGKGKYAQKHVPAHLRHLLQAESGCNDGAAFPFLYLAMFLLLREESSVGHAIGSWFLLVILYQILLGIVIGIAIGILARKTLKFCKRRSMIDRESMVAMYVALALLTTGLTTLAGSDDLLAAFACGAAFAWDDWFTESIEASNFSGIIDLLINCATFIYVGATIPFSAWKDPTITLIPWRLVLLGISILVLRRLPAMLLFQKLIPDLKTNREAVFCGHFGPIGVGAIFISTLAASKLPTPTIPPQTSLDVLSLTVQPLIYLLVLFSILVHGLSIPFFTLGQNVHSRVHSMTRTWTQASGNEPSWLSRVKRVDRTSVVNSIDPRGDNLPPSLTPQDSQNEPLSQAGGGEKQTSDDQVTQVGDEIGVAPAAQETTPLELQDEVPNSNSNLISAQLPLLPTPVRNTTEPAVMQATSRGLNSRVGLLRLGSTCKRTHEEQEAHHREKLLRDEWCRRERVDNIKKDEERVYKSGRHIVIERGDGDIVEVRDIDPPLVTSSRTKRIPHFAAAGVGAGSSQAPEGPTSRLLASRRLESAKNIVHLFRKNKACDKVGGITDVSNLQEPPPHCAPGGIETLPEASCKSSDLHGLPGGSADPCSEERTEYKWLEGNHVVTEDQTGEVISVEPAKSKRLMNQHSLPTMSQSVAENSQSQKPENTSLPNLNDTSNHPTVIFPVEDGEWEEEGTHERSEPLAALLKAPRRAISRPGRRRASSRVLRRPRRVASNSHWQSPNFEEPTSSTQSRMVEFADAADGRERLGPPRQRSLSRSSSPSRSIRFAEHPVRPSGQGSLKRKGYKKSKNTLLGLVSARESSRRSSITVDNLSEQGGAGPTDLLRD